MEIDGRQFRSIHHFNTPFDAHELTFTCFHRRPFLLSDRARQWFAESIVKARKKHGFHLWAYVLMPEHLHLLIWFPHEPYSVEAALRSMKQPVGQKAVNYLRKKNQEGLALLRTGHKHTPYRFWQDGPGYDRNLHDPKAIRASVDYIHNNPVRRGLAAFPENWPWSSYLAWTTGAETPIPVDMESFPHG